MNNSYFLEKVGDEESGKPHWASRSWKQPKHEGMMDERSSGNGPNGPQHGSGVLHAPEVPDRGGAQARPGGNDQITTGAPAPSAGGQQGHRGNQFGAAGIIGGSGEQIQPKGGGILDEKPVINRYEPRVIKACETGGMNSGNLPDAAAMIGTDGGTMGAYSGFNGGSAPAFPTKLDERGYGVGTPSSAIGGKERDQR